ncbi:DUF4857 domain-containing protein [Saccharicrinis sp. 156]|uniref:DUF4857 domain-containing protein n=1 Tax=Saccharicrinis sp. 156 TaxID=3417574 RepID=UPI003D34FFB4
MKIIKYTIIILSTLLLAWIIPGIYHLMTDKSMDLPFACYSSVEKAFCTIDVRGKHNTVRKNVNTGMIYTQSEFDSILPMFYIKQLLSDTRFPESINGKAVNGKEARKKIFYLSYNPTEKRSPGIPLYSLLESSSGRVKLKMPGDVFRINSKIEFIDPETNMVIRKKSDLFMKAFVHSDFVFPAREVYGSSFTRKAYDEGYLILDNIGQVFHLKMVRGKPMLKNIGLPKDMKVAYIVRMEPEDKSFYAFMFDDQNRMYLITTDGYRIQELKTPKFDLDTDRLTVMANPLFWTVSVISSLGKESYALEAQSKQLVDSISLMLPPSTDYVLSYGLPFEISFTSPNSKYVSPIIHFAKVGVLVTNVLFTILYCFLMYYRQKPYGIYSLIWIMLTGFFGFIPALIITD